MKSMEKINKLELDPRDNHTAYLNGEKVEGITYLDIDVTGLLGCEVTISFVAEIGVRNE